MTVTVADGTVYVVGKDPSVAANSPNIFYTQEEYEKSDFIPLRTLSEMTAEELYGDFNGDGTVDALDASVILQYSADVGADAFTGTFKEYVEKEQ